MNQQLNLPRISFKGVFTFLIILSIGILLLVKPLMFLGISKSWSLFLATSLSATAGMSTVLLFIDDKVKDRSGRMKRILLSLVVSFVLSYVLVFIAK